LEASQRTREAQKVVNVQIKKIPFILHPRPTISPPTNLSSPSPSLKIHKLTCIEIVECQLKGLYYNYNEKYYPRYKCKEQNLFMVISKDISNDEANVITLYIVHPRIECIPPSTLQYVEPQISLHALIGISTPQTLKLIVYIKHRKVIVLIDNNNTHSFIHQCLTQETHRYIHVVNNFQIMIANGDSMKCGGHCENVMLQMGDYSLKTHMFVIEMGGCEIVLGVEQLQILGTITMDLCGLYMSFQ
jgi:hypothetical protein